ncbi:MAG: universal stress protein [Pseudomonadota bacterium]
MKPLKKILLASHGSPGTRAAERAAIRMAAPGATLFHLVVVPEFWSGMQGDDWLNNAATRDAFARHVETTLEREVQSEIRRVERAARRRKLKYRSRTIFGKPDDCLLDAVRSAKPQLIVTGSLRRKGKTGLRSRMLTDDLLRRLTVPLLVVPSKP